jgi:hypothetical protein
MMKRKLLLFLSASAFGTAIAIIVLYGEQISLRSQADTPVLSPFQGKGVERNVVSIIRPGEKVEVIGCESTKSSVEIEVRLSSGRSGFVVDGDYLLERKKVSLSSLARPYSMVFSCRGIFAPISEPSGRAWPSQRTTPPSVS